MLRLGFSILFAFVMLASAVSCALIPDPPAPNPVTPAPPANRASVYCEQNGGKVDLRVDVSGGTVGICVFKDASECDEWAYYRGTCQPGAVQTPRRDVSPTTPPVVETPRRDVSWKVSRDAQFGYSLRYPPDATIGHADDPTKSLTITGPLVGNDHWPVIYFSHPSDREEYRPPQGVDLEKWLTDHNLMMTRGQGAEMRQPDTSIAGTRAIHTRFARSPQSYAYDKYWFAKGQQLYSVVILHTGDKQDWALYDQFLASIQFP